MKPYSWALKSLSGAVVLGMLGFVAPALADVIAPVQSSADPMGLKIVAPVEVGGSDAAAVNFMQALPSLNALIKAKLPEYKAQTAASVAAMALDPSTFRMAADLAVRVYFINEGAAYHSSLGFNTFPATAGVPSAATPRITAGAQWIFPDASSSDPSSLNSTGNSVRTSSEPLLPGDFVDLGIRSAGTLLDFFLVPYGATGGTAVLTDETARNADNFQHIVSFWSADSRYLLLSFEDTVGGGDRDYNDVVFAVDFSPAFQQATVSPEPGTWASLAALGLLGVWNSRQKNRPAPAA